MIKSLTTGLQKLAFNNTPVIGIVGNLKHIQNNQCFQQNNIHTSSVCAKEPTGFLRHNDKFFPIQGFDEERRPAYVCHQKCDIKYSYKKMLYAAWLVRGLSVDEAIKQLSYILQKGGAIAKETILEAQKLAVEKHNVEFKSNLWVAESFVSKSFVIKGIRRHARMRVGEVRYGFIHYFVRLEEGTPPKDYYKLNPKNSDEMLADYKAQLRTRKVPNSL